MTSNPLTPFNAQEPSQSILQRVLSFVSLPLSFLAAVVPLLLAVAFFTVYERQLLAALQRRQGPNVVGFYGLFQPLADGLKLFLKESIIPKSANTLLFLLSPVVTFGLARAGWAVFPLSEGSRLVDFRLGLLYLFALSSLSVHSVIRAGWSSNSKYAFLGGLRSAAQRISYEVSLGATLVSLLLLSGSLNLSSIVEAQENHWFGAPLLPVFVLFFITTLAETNRHPFDLPEAEAELVSGYNVEYSARGFALFFLAEGSNIILRSSLSALLFLGGWHSVFFLSFIPSTLVFALKTRFFVTLFILVRGALPRYRYDQLRRLGWKVFLPLSLACLVRYAALLLGANGVVELARLFFRPKNKPLLGIKELFTETYSHNQTMTSSFHTYRDLGLLVAFLGAFGLLLNKRHILLSLLCIERRFYGLNFFLVALSVSLDDRLGELFALFVLTLAAAESALALGLLTAYFRVYGNILLKED